MRKTKFKVMTGYGISNGPTYRRVYEDDNGKKYIRTKDGYVYIEDKPCIRYLLED